MAFHVPNQCRFRLRGHPLYSTDLAGNNGAFAICLSNGSTAFAIASDQGEWEHVSVSMQDRCPTWDEMCEVKALFWDDEDCVIQYHPPVSQYVNFHPYCLHLWRPTQLEFPTPPTYMVGPTVKEMAS
jgi:uncharacterized protein YaaQ